MKSDRPSQSRIMAWSIGTAAGVVIMLLGFSIRSLVMLFAGPQQSGTIRQESTAADEKQDVSVQNEGQGAQNNEQETGPITAPIPAPAMPDQLSGKAPGFTVDYQTLREREAGRKEMAKTIREVTKDNPESGYAMTEEQLRKFEQSGASFQ